MGHSFSAPEETDPKSGIHDTGGSLLHKRSRHQVADCMPGQDIDATMASELTAPPADEFETNNGAGGTVRRPRGRPKLEPRADDMLSFDTAMNRWISKARFYHFFLY
jgi:hypothetical protein